MLDGRERKRESLKRWVEANKMKIKEDDNEVLMLSLNEMATCGQAGGDLVGYYYEHGGFGCLSSMSVKGIAVAKKLMQLQTELSR